MSRPGSHQLASLAVAALIGCNGGCSGGGGDGGPTDNFDRRALLANLAERVLAPTFSELDTAAQALAGAVTSYCASIDTATESETRDAARDAWRAAMVLTQRAEVMRIGPAAADDGRLRDELYSWPVTSTCAVDQEVKSYFDGPSVYDISGVLTNRRGMDALEYTLFSEDLEHTCAPQVAPPGWDQLGTLERVRARCGYAAEAAADVAATAAELASGWDSFVTDLSTAGLDGSSFNSAQIALNVVSDAMFFVEFEVKDIKIGESSGITENSCDTIGEACVEELESQFAAHTKENVVANLTAFRDLFTGLDGVGFDDMLVELGAADLATAMTADIDAMIAAAGAVDGSFRDALTTRYSEVAAVHGAIKSVTDNLKSQFLTVLGLDIPDNSAGDND